MAKAKNRSWVNPQNSNITASGKLFPGPSGKKPIVPLKGSPGPRNTFKPIKKI